MPKPARAVRGRRHPDHRTHRLGPDHDDPRTAGARPVGAPVDREHRLRPSDVDVAELYDGFSFNCLSWLEALGFCGIGEAKDFLDGGKNIARDGVDPAQHPRRPALARPHPRHGPDPRGGHPVARREPANGRSPTPASPWSAAAASPPVERCCCGPTHDARRSCAVPRPRASWSTACRCRAWSPSSRTIRARALSSRSMAGQAPAAYFDLSRPSGDCRCCAPGQHPGLHPMVALDRPGYGSSALYPGRDGAPGPTRRAGVRRNRQDRSAGEAPRGRDCSCSRHSVGCELAVRMAVDEHAVHADVVGLELAGTGGIPPRDAKTILKSRLPRLVRPTGLRDILWQPTDSIRRRADRHDELHEPARPYEADDDHEAGRNRTFRARSAGAGASASSRVAEHERTCGRSRDLRRHRAHRSPRSVQAAPPSASTERRPGYRPQYSSIDHCRGSYHRHVLSFDRRMRSRARHMAKTRRVDARRIHRTGQSGRAQWRGGSPRAGYETDAVGAQGGQPRSSHTPTRRRRWPPHHGRTGCGERPRSPLCRRRRRRQAGPVWRRPACWPDWRRAASSPSTAPCTPTRAAKIAEAGCQARAFR